MWAFTDRVSLERRVRLTRVPNFEAVVSAILRTVDKVLFEWEAATAGRLRGCHRASFLLRVSDEAYDAFFNSPKGYRGQYARSTEIGEAANRAMLSRLNHHLVASIPTDRFPLEPLIACSLRASAAKCWIYEREVELQMGETEPQILFDAWQLASEDGAGLLAPIGRCLEVKGGWVDQDGTERLDPSKSSRSEKIHTVGFA